MHTERLSIYTRLSRMHTELLRMHTGRLSMCTGLSRMHTEPSRIFLFADFFPSIVPVAQEIAAKIIMTPKKGSLGFPDSLPIYPVVLQQAYRPSIPANSLLDQL